MVILELLLQREGIFVYRRKHTANKLPNLLLYMDMRIQHNFNISSVSQKMKLSKFGIEN
jgi:hypothetical protein